MKDLILAGYPTSHSALLASAVLSRQQKELMLADDDIAVLSRETFDLTTIRESVSLSKNNQPDKNFWKSLSRLLFPVPDETVDLPPTKLSALGIDEIAIESINAAIPAGTTAILVLAEKTFAGRVAGILGGFQGAVTRIPLLTDNPKQTLHAIPMAG